MQSLEPRRLLAAQPVLVRDINPGVAGAEPHELVDVNGTLYFAANNGRHGVELWKSDGTPEGTVRVTDIRPGRGSSHPQELTNVNGTLYFTADNGGRRGLWKSDGTPEGTTLLLGGLPLASGVFETFTGLTAVGDQLVFHWGSGDKFEPGSSSAEVVATRDGREFTTWSTFDFASEPSDVVTTDGSSVFLTLLDGRQVWRSRPNSTTLVLDRTGRSSIETLAAVPSETGGEGQLFFTSARLANGVQGWGLSRVADAAGELPLGPAFEDGIWDLAAVGNTLFFSTGGSLWTSDGTSEATKSISGSDLWPTEIVDVEGTAFGIALNNGSHRSLWRSDGSAENTFEVMRFPGLMGSQDELQPLDLTPVRRTLFLTASDGASGRELWMVPAEFGALSDGTLHVSGTAGNDNLSLIVRGSELRVWLEGSGTLTFPIGDVSRIAIDSGGGDDTIDWTGIAIPTYCFGGLGNDRMTAGTGDDTLSGGGGRDYLSGGGGDDFVSGGATNDELYGGPGADHLEGGAANDLLAGGAHDDRLYGDAGNDVLSGNHGKDVLYGGDGDDDVTGGAGWDLHSGQGGNDRLFARDGRDDEVLGGDGEDGGSLDDLVDVSLGIESLLA